MIGATALKRQFRDYRDIGGEYLNYQFGWKPFVNDLRAISEAIATSEKRLAQLKRDSGRLVRRRFEFPTVVSSTETHSYTGRRGYPSCCTHYYRDSPDLMITTHNYQRTWFSGAFTFHFELPDRQKERLAYQAQKARVLLGLDLTPSVVWNLSPWSWLADWVSNTGDILHNASAFGRDGLVLHHGYVMQHSAAVRAHTLKGVTARQTGPYAIREGYNATYHPQGDFTDTFTREVKLRRKATPFGFGLDTGAFTDRQWLILGALGLSKGPRSLT